MVLMQVLLEATSLTLRFSCYTFRIFRILLSVIFLSMPVMLLSTLNMIRLLWYESAFTLGFGRRDTVVGVRECFFKFLCWENSTYFI